MPITCNNILSNIEKLRTHPHIVDKKHIRETYSAIGDEVSSSAYFGKNSSPIKIGDDAAAIPQEDGSHLLLAAEGIVTYFLEKDPWFAGYSAIMVNISDICSMGGLPIAVTDTLYAKNAEDTELIWEGMRTASERYGVPIVGGHTCYHNDYKALSVSILGKASQHLLTSFDACVGDELLIVIDHNGSYYKEYPFWNASTNTNGKRLQKLIQLPYEVANRGWSTCAKDISMGGIIGTLLMLMNTSNIGIHLNLDKLTKPQGIDWNKWLVSFPSYGYIISCKPTFRQNIQKLFQQHNIQCDPIGSIIDDRELFITHKKDTLKF